LTRLKSWIFGGVEGVAEAPGTVGSGVLQLMGRYLKGKAATFKHGT